eukprot:476906_1
MALKYSTIVSIIYFCVNIVFLIGLGVYVYKIGAHEKLKSKSYLKDLWNQRKIFAPLIIHFYDTATDIGVIYNWAELANDEKKTDFESVDMKTFLWCGVAFLIVYRVGLLGMALAQWFSNEGEWYYLFLVLLDLYIFVIVYESFNKAQGIISKNAEKRAINKKKKHEKAIQKHLEHAIEAGTITKDQAQRIQFGLQEVVEIEPAETQMIVQLMESVTESMPQIVLQSVFLIRSQNDPLLKESGANFGLIMFSVLASLFSISNKYVWMDKEFVEERSQSLKPRERFPDCIQYWYLVRVAWRFCNLLAKFVVFTLIWTVLGGVWLPIWIGLLFIIWGIIILVNTYDSDEVIPAIASAVLFSVITIVAIWMSDRGAWWLHVGKWIETSVAFTLITIFGTIKFDCSICHNAETRMIFGNGVNTYILMYWVFGVSAHIVEAVLYSILYFGNIIKNDIGNNNIYHDRWSVTFGEENDENDDEAFKHLIEDHKTQRITGVRVWESMEGVEFQVNGVWMGKNGKHDDKLGYQELILKTEEYINRITIDDDLEYVEFGTNNAETSISSGIQPDEMTTFSSIGFKLVDCKGRSSDKKVTQLQFLWHKID